MCHGLGDPIGSFDPDLYDNEMKEYKYNSIHRDIAINTDIQQNQILLNQ